jgi:hypothetical protein
MAHSVAADYVPSLGVFPRRIESRLGSGSLAKRKLLDLLHSMQLTQESSKDLFWKGSKTSTEGLDRQGIWGIHISARGQRRCTTRLCSFPPFAQRLIRAALTGGYKENKARWKALARKSLECSL